MFAIQLAHRMGARVATTASGRHRDFLRTLGADEVIDYKTERFEAVAQKVDVIFDCVGGERRWKPSLMMTSLPPLSLDTSGTMTSSASTIPHPKAPKSPKFALGGVKTRLGAKNESAGHAFNLQGCLVEGSNLRANAVFIRVRGPLTHK